MVRVWELGFRVYKAQGRGPCVEASNPQQPSNLFSIKERRKKKVKKEKRTRFLQQCLRFLHQV